MGDNQSRKYKFGSAYSSPVEQYPNQSQSGRREFRVIQKGEEGSDSASYHGHSASMDNSIGVSNSDYGRSSEYVNKSAAADFGYPQHRPESLPSQMATPETEQPPTSPMVSDIDDRTESVADPRDMPARGTSERMPSRTRYDYVRSQEDLDRTPRSHARTRSQPSSSKQRQSSNSRRPPIPVRKPSGSGRQYSSPPTPDTATENWGPGDRSSAESIVSQETAATSISTLPALQTKGPENNVQQLEPLMEDDPRSWDLVDPVDESGGPTGMYALEKRAEQMFSSEHLRTIFNDPKLLLKFTNFLNTHRPKSIAILIYYLDALKALRAINYANAIAEALDPIRGQDFTQHVASPTKNAALEEKAERAFEMLSMEDLPAFISHTWIQVVSVSIQRRITGTLAPHLREASEGLAEVFCLTDPSRTDNPMVFASEEFVRTTQYGMNYVIGRNCRFLQGPRTNPHSVRRLQAATKSGKEHNEVFVNYRRDGSPFMNLLMTAPLMDSRGNTRYFIGAQVDVSNLVKECSNLDGLMRLVEKEQEPEVAAEEEEANKKDEFQDLSEMFNSAELETVRKYGGRMHKEYADESDRESVAHDRRRLLLKDTSQEVLEKHGGNGSSGMPPSIKERINGKLEGVYQHYLLIRPAPSLRILFTSPSLRVPGILQSPFLNRIGGSSRVRSDLRAALGEGRGVTAKIRWLTRADEDGEGEGRPRWIHCTPLFGHSGSVGVWMIVLVDEENPGNNGTGRRFRAAPPVSTNIGGKEWDSRGGNQRRQLNTYDADNERRGGGLRPDQAPHHHLSHNNSEAPSNPERPGSSFSAGNQQGVSRGDVSEFSFQLKR